MSMRMACEKVRSTRRAVAHDVHDRSCASVSVCVFTPPQAGTPWRTNVGTHREAIRIGPF